MGSSDSNRLDGVRTRSSRDTLPSFLRSNVAAWRDEDHPELAAGTGKYVAALRRESDRRIGIELRSQQRKDS